MFKEESEGGLAVGVQELEVGDVGDAVVKVIEVEGLSATKAPAVWGGMLWVVMERKEVVVMERERRWL